MRSIGETAFGTLIESRAARQTDVASRRTKQQAVRELACKRSWLQLQ